MASGWYKIKTIKMGRYRMLFIFGRKKIFALSFIMIIRKIWQNTCIMIKKITLCYPGMKCSLTKLIALEKNSYSHKHAPSECWHRLLFSIPVDTEYCFTLVSGDSTVVSSHMMHPVTPECQAPTRHLHNYSLTLLDPWWAFFDPVYLTPNVKIKIKIKM